MSTRIRHLSPVKTIDESEIVSALDVVPVERNEGNALGGANQMELGLRSTLGTRPRRVHRQRRYVAARWWFARMRESVRTAPDWETMHERLRESDQAVLSLTQAPTRFERR